MNKYIVIMAGGKGERFWPVSRQSTPKQLITLLQERSLLQQAVDRVLPLVPASQIFVITNRAQKEAVLAQLPNLSVENIIAEPCGRDTCAAVTLGGALVASRDPQAVMAILPADHLIPDAEKFRKILSDGLGLASTHNSVITIGIKPTEPATGYGYIHAGEHLDCSMPFGTAFSVAERFVEKPNLETAKTYIADGHYLWNAGMFIWRCDTLAKALELHQPEMFKAFSGWKRAAEESPEKLTEVLESEYPSIKKISVDFALMERVKNIIVADGLFDWDDLGAWPALMRHLSPDSNGNCSNSTFIEVDSSDNLIFDARKKSSKVLTTLLGVRNSVIVFTDDVTMIANKSETQRIKELLAKIVSTDSYKHLG